MCAREEIHANLRKTSEDVGLSNQCTTTTCIQKCANFSSMEAAEAMPTSKNFSSKCHKTQCQGSLLTGIDKKTSEYLEGCTLCLYRGSSAYAVFETLGKNNL